MNDDACPTSSGSVLPRGGWTRSCALIFAELAQLIDKDFLCKLLAGVARSLETGGNI